MDGVGGVATTSPRTVSRSLGVRRVVRPARRACRRAHHRRGAALQPAPDHPGRGHERPEAPQERQGPRDRRRRPRLARPALPRRRRRRHPRHRRVRRGGRVQPAAPDHPRPVRRRPPQGGVGTRLDPGDQPAGQRRGPQRAPRQRQRQARLRGLRPDRRRHRQLRHALHGQRRGVLPRDPLRVGLDLPLRRPGVGLRADARRGPALLPLPLPRAAAAGHGPELRRGRRARRAVRQHRLHPGQRGHQAAHRHRRARSPAS